MKKNILLLSICLFQIMISSAQNSELKGHIVDQDNMEPLPFATVEINTLKKGVYADTSGFFTISIPKENLQDTIDFRFLGYAQKKLTAAQLVDNGNITIQLEKAYTELKEVIVTPVKTKVIKLGVKSKKPWKYQLASIFGGQYGNYIENKLVKSGFVKSVSFYIAEVGHTNTPFRVRIYSKDKIHNCPGEDLLTENLIVKNTNGVGWFTVDLSEYSVIFPKDGIFVMMEWIYTGDEFYYAREGTRKLDDGTWQKVQGKFYGQSIGNVKNQKSMCMWSKGLGEKWTAWEFYNKGYINVMINADIVLEK